MWALLDHKWVQPAISPGLAVDPPLPGALALPPASALISVLALLSQVGELRQPVRPLTDNLATL